jgi:hypothetical protein
MLKTLSMPLCNITPPKPENSERIDPALKYKRGKKKSSHQYRKK